MTGLSLRHRIAFATVGLVGVAAHLAIVDFGINAGRIHHGVRVGDILVGGMVESDAADFLAEVGAEMRDDQVVFTAEGLVFEFTPREFGWLPLERPTAARAHEIGRTGGIVAMLQDRVRAWSGGVHLRWPDELNRRRIGTRLNALERQAQALGYTLDRAEMSRRIKQAIWSWPREELYEIPVTRD